MRTRRNGFKRMAAEVSQQKFENERCKAMSGVYSGEYKDALITATSVDEAINYLRNKAEEYTRKAQEWAAKTYKRTKAGTRVNARHDDMCAFYSYTALNEIRRDRSVAMYTQYASNMMQYIETLKQRVY